MDIAQQKAYFEHSKSLSDNVRKAVYAGLGIAWILQESVSKNEINRSISVVILFFTFSIGFDLLQNIFGSIIWNFFLHNLNNQFGEIDNRQGQVHPIDLSKTMNVFFILKLITALLGILFLVKFIIFRII